MPRPRPAALGAALRGAGAPAPAPRPCLRSCGRQQLRGSSARVPEAKPSAWVNEGILGRYQSTISEIIMESAKSKGVMKQTAKYVQEILKHKSVKDVNASGANSISGILEGIQFAEQAMGGHVPKEVLRAVMGVRSEVFNEVFVRHATNEFGSDHGMATRGIYGKLGVAMVGIHLAFPSADAQAPHAPVVLDCGTGDGLEALVSAAFVAKHGGRVVSIDVDEKFLRVAGHTLREVAAELAPSITLRHADMWSYAPATPGERYDAIIVNGELEKEPAHLISLLRPRGRLVYVQRHPGCCDDAVRGSIFENDGVANRSMVGAMISRCEQLKVASALAQQADASKMTEVANAQKELCKNALDACKNRERPARTRPFRKPECLMAHWKVIVAGAADGDAPFSGFNSPDPGEMTISIARATLRPPKEGTESTATPGAAAAPGGAGGRAKPASLAGCAEVRAAHAAVVATLPPPPQPQAGAAPQAAEGIAGRGDAAPALATARDGLIAAGVPEGLVSSIWSMQHPHGRAFVIGILAGAPTPPPAQWGDQFPAHAEYAKRVAAVEGRVVYCNAASGSTPVWFWSEPTKGGEWWWTIHCPEPGTPLFGEERVFPSAQGIPKWCDPCSTTKISTGPYKGVSLIDENGEVVVMLSKFTKSKLDQKRLNQLGQEN